MGKYEIYLGFLLREGDSQQIRSSLEPGFLNSYFCYLPVLSCAPLLEQALNSCHTPCPLSNLLGRPTA